MQQYISKSEIYQNFSQVCGIGSIIHNLIDVNILINSPDQIQDPTFQKNR